MKYPPHQTFKMVRGGLCSIKYLSLAVLTAQNASLILIMCYSRNRAGDMYIASTAVMLTEIIKLATSALILLADKRGIMEWLKCLHSHTLGQPLDMLKMAVPACIYTIQNNLLYIALSNLDAATYQVTYQLKILTTAIVSVIMLNKSLNKFQWLSLFMLFVGVSVVQLQPIDGSPKSPSQPQVTQKNAFVGLVCVVVSSVCSAFAGVYFEKTLKGTHTPLWVRNVQLALFGSAIGMVGMFMNDGAKIRENGLLFGYDALVWLILGLQAFGGLLVGFVVKYADNILKGFAAALSIVLSCMMSVCLFDFRLSVQFVIGAGLVMVATYIYGAAQRPDQATNKSQKSREQSLSHFD